MDEFWLIDQLQSNCSQRIYYLIAKLIIVVNKWWESKQVHTLAHTHRNEQCRKVDGIIGWTFIIRCNQMIKSVGMVWAPRTILCWHCAWLSLCVSAFFLPRCRCILLFFFIICRLHSLFNGDVQLWWLTHTHVYMPGTLRGRNNNYQL